MLRRNCLWLIGTLTALNEVARAVAMGPYGLAKRQGMHHHPNVKRTAFISATFSRDHRSFTSAVI